MLDLDRLNVTTRIVARLYIRDVCRDLTRPLSILYPELAAEYKAMITHPTDLGTILLRCMKDGMKLDELKSELSVMIQNALQFNQGQVMLENIAYHILSFAIGLFEEISGVSWDKSGGPNVILARRRNRCFILEQEYLHQSELKELCELLIGCAQKFPELADHDDRIVAILKCKSACEEAISSMSSIDLCSVFEPLADIIISDSGNDASVDPDSLPAIVTLLFLQRLKTDNIEDTTKSLSSCIALRRKKLTLGSPESAPGEMTPLSIISAAAAKHAATDKTTLEVLRALDGVIGEVLVCMEERFARGSEESSYWAKPLEAVWAQPDSKETALSKLPWWPCAVIGGGSGTCVPKSLTSANINRLPTEVVKQLKQRCRFFMKGIGSAEMKVIQSRVYHDGTSHRDHDDRMRLNDLEIPDVLERSKSSISLSPWEEKESCDEALLQPLRMPSTAQLALDTDNRPSDSEKMIADPLVIPPKCLLVEYFDVHDVGLVFADYVIPMNSSAKFPCKGPVATKKMGAGEDANMKVFRIFASTVGSMTAGQDHDAVSLPSVEQLEHLVSVSAEASSLKFEERTMDPSANGPRSTKVADIISKAIASVEAGSGDNANADKEATSSSNPSTVTVRDLNVHETRKRKYTEKEEKVSFPPYSEAFSWGHFDVSLIPIKAISTSAAPGATPGVPLPARTRGGDVSKVDFSKKQRALSRTRAVVEWLEATAPLQASAARVQEGEKEEPYDTPLSLQIKSLKVAAGISNVPQSIDSTKDKGTRDGSPPRLETPIVSTIKRPQFRTADHITKDFSRVVSSLPPSVSTCRFLCGNGVVHTRSMAVGTLVCKLESALVDDRIAVLRSQIREFDKKVNDEQK